MTEIITSTRNQRVVAAAKLARRSEREDRDRYLVEGPHAVAAALDAGTTVRIFVTEELHPEYEDADCEVVVVADHVMERVADSVTPQGVVVEARIERVSLSAVVGHGVLIVLDGISDPGNAGTIIRTAHAAGAAGVVLTAGSVDPFNPKAVRATAGSVVAVPIVTGVALGDVAGACRAAGQPVVGLDADAPDSVFSLAAPTCTLVLGSEAHGLDEDAGRFVDRRVRIPMPGGAESLNLAAAAAVATYAAVRGAAAGPAGTQAAPARRNRPETTRPGAAP